MSRLPSSLLTRACCLQIFFFFYIGKKKSAAVTPHLIRSKRLTAFADKEKLQQKTSLSTLDPSEKFRLPVEDFSAFSSR